MKDKKMIKDILKNFDFKSVHKAMEALNWTWDSTDGVPSVKQLKKKAKKELQEVLEKDCRECGTGGFEASYEDGILTLKFVLEYWDVDKNEEI